MLKPISIISLLLATSSLAAISDRFAVVGVISQQGNKPNDSIAVIKDKNKSGSNLILRVGDKLGNTGYKIASVTKKKVYAVNNSKKRIVLYRDSFGSDSSSGATNDNLAYLRDHSEPFNDGAIDNLSPEELMRGELPPGVDPNRIPPELRHLPPEEFDDEFFDFEDDLQFLDEFEDGAPIPPPPPPNYPIDEFNRFDGGGIPGEPGGVNSYPGDDSGFPPPDYEINQR